MPSAFDEGGGVVSKPKRPPFVTVNDIGRGHMFYCNSERGPFLVICIWRRPGRVLARLVRWWKTKPWRRAQR